MLENVNITPGGTSLQFACFEWGAVAHMAVLRRRELRMEDSRSIMESAISVPSKVHVKIPVLL